MCDILHNDIINKNFKNDSKSWITVLTISKNKEEIKYENLKDIIAFKTYFDSFFGIENIKKDVHHEKNTYFLLGTSQ